MFLLFLSSGMFLGWSLGANDAANVFGTAVGTRMLKFNTAAALCCIFVILGAVISGAGASGTLGKLGAVNAVAGASVVAFAAAISVYLMIRVSYPASSSQAIVGAIVGWNIFTGTPTDTVALLKIVSTWVICPVLSGVIAVISYKFVTLIISRSKIHIFKLDEATRIGLILVGIFGSYSLGANNIANVVGVFLPVSPFVDITIFGGFHLSPAQQLFFLGSLAISLGVITYSKKIMETVGKGIFKLSPVMALVVVWAQSVVLFLFASQRLEQTFIDAGLPALPLVPVSSSQAIVGAVIGIGLLKGGHNIRWKTVGGIAGSWIITPVFACLLSFTCLFIVQNVFQLTVYIPQP